MQFIIIKVIKSYSIILVLFFILVSNLQAQDTLGRKKGIDYKILPIAYYLPETSWAFGVASVATFRISDIQKKASVFQFVADYTLNKQFLFITAFDIFVNEEDWRFIGEFSYFRYKYNFFGLGIRSRKDDFEKYQANYPRIRFAAYRKIINNFKLGLLYQLEGINSIDFETGGLIDRNNYEGKNGGIVSNVGAGFLYDSRNNIISADKGYFGEIQFHTSSQNLGAAFRYRKISIDNRYYFKINEKLTFASNIYAASIFGSAPFYDYYTFGSSSKARGVNDRRFWGKSIFLSQCEIRFPIIGRFRGAIFGSLSTVNDNINDIFNDKFINAFGAGLRYVLNKEDRSMIRLDVGKSQEGYNFYFTSNEAF